jgi:hypothetical protein
VCVLDQPQHGLLPGETGTLLDQDPSVRMLLLELPNVAELIPYMASSAPYGKLRLKAK